MVEIKAADLEVRCFFTWRIKGHIRFDGSGGMETGDWTAVGFRLSAFDCRLSAYRCPWDGIPERGPRLPTIRLQTLDSIDFTYHSGVPPFGGWRHHLARWEACHWIRGSRGSPMNPVPLPPPQFGGAVKGKRLNGQARRLTSPHLEVLCRTSTGAL